MRRTTLSMITAGTAIAASLAIAPLASAQDKPKLKIGLMLPSSGTYAALGTAIENGFRLHVAEQGGKLGGREITFFKVDDESDPAKATDNVNKLIKRDGVDVVVGSVHSGVALAMARAVKASRTLLIVPNAGADAVTGPMCAPNIFRSSFSNWQPGYAMGQVMAAKGHKKAIAITWKYAAGEEMVRGFREAFEKAGADVLFSPGLPDIEAVRLVCRSLTRPFNFMVGMPGRSFSVAELEAAGVRRISLASTLYRAAMSGLIGAAREALEAGTFGYLERMHAGVSGEVLWKPVDSQLALGVELNYTKQRDTDGGLGFDEYDYDVVTGYVSAYYDFGNGYLGQLDVGRYLAGDVGATLSLDRVFANGWRVGAFATVTDVSAAEFGEGGFDKGIRFTVPFNWALGTDSRRGFGMTLRPKTGDGGARVDVDDRLYESLREYHTDGLDPDWGRVWR